MRGALNAPAPANPGAAIHDRLIGREVEVLVEGPARRSSRAGAADQLFGKSDDFKTVVFANDGTPAGALRRVRIVGATPITLIGEGVGAAPRSEALLTIGG